MEIEDAEMTETENSQQDQENHQWQKSSNSQLACYQKNEDEGNKANPSQSKTINYAPYIIGALVSLVLVTGYFISRKRSN